MDLGRLAQLVERLTLNQRVVGSSPTSPTIHFRDLAEIACRTAAVCAADIVFRSGPLFAAVGEGDGPAWIGLRG